MSSTVDVVPSLRKVRAKRSPEVRAGEPSSATELRKLIHSFGSHMWQTCPVTWTHREERRQTGQQHQAGPNTCVKRLAGREGVSRLPRSTAVTR